MKTLLRLAVPAASFLLISCLGGDDASPLPDYVTQVRAIDREAKTITLHDDYYYCDGEDLIHDSDTYYETWSIEGGKLYRQWDEDACTADVYTGASTDIVGTWKANPPTYDTLRTGEDCEEEFDDAENFTRITRNMNITSRISETNIVESATGEPCFAESMARDLQMDGNEEIETITAECSSVRLRGADDATARITGSYSGGKIKMTFKTGNITCTGSLPVTDADPMSCKDGGAEEIFKACVAATGFYGALPEYPEEHATAKAAAARKHRALRTLGL
jgi:hypothetical protein